MKNATWWKSIAPYSLATLVLGALITLWLVHQQQQDNQAIAQAQLRSSSKRITNDVLQRFQLYEYGTRGVRGLVTATLNNGLTREQVQAYSRTRDIELEFPGSRGFGYIERVPKAQTDSYLARARADGAPTFAIKQLTAHDDERFVIRYIEPLKNNMQALGLDIGSEAKRRQAAWHALQNNEATITAPITLVQASGATLRSFLLLLPVYDPSLPTTTPQEREVAGLGWAYTPLVTDEVLEGLKLEKDLLNFSMVDVTPGSPAEVFYAQNTLDPKSTVPGLSASYQQRVHGREWRIEFQAHPSFVAQLKLTPPATVGTVGTLITALLVVLQSLWATISQRRREAAETNALLATIVESASDAIVSESTDGRILSWNKAAESMFGYPREAVIGQPIARILLPPERQEEDMQMLHLAATQGVTEPVETNRKHQDGRLIDVSMTVSALRDAQGELTGSAKLLRDISERKRHEQSLTLLNADLENRVQERTKALDEASRFLMTVLNSVPLMIAYLQSDLTCRVANRAFGKALGMEPQEADAQPLQSLMPPAVFEPLLPHLNSALQGEVQTFEFVIPGHAAQGNRELSAQLIPDLDGSVVSGLYLIAQDVSKLNEQRRQLEHSFKQQRDERLRLQSIIQGTGAGTWEWNVQTGALRLNDEWARQLGYTLAELEPCTFETWVRLMHPEDLTTARGKIEQHFAGELPSFEMESRMRHRNGEWVWILGRGQVITRDERGQPEWMFGTHLDIDRRKVAEEQLRNSEMFLERVGKVAGVGGWRITLPDKAITWTHQTREISGVDKDYTPQLAEAMAFYPQEVQPTLKAAIQHTIDAGEPFDLELPYITAQGEHRWVRSVGEAEYDPLSKAEGPVALVGALMDFTERHAAAETLKRAQQDAEAANRSKSAFLANMSHEIRTPLNAVLGIFYLLADTRLDAGQRRLLGKAQLAGRSLLSIVNDVLDLAKIESGELLLTHEPYVLTDLLHEVETIYAPQATNKQVAFHLDIDETLPPWLVGDAQRVRQILTNLVGNALKFTKAGRIDLMARRTTRGETPALKLLVRDTGVGIPFEVQDQLFKPFIQADATTTRQFGGTGLGLSIVRQLSDHMGGSAGLSSTPGQGSEFWVELPLVTVSGDQGLGGTDHGEPLEIAVVDPNASDRAATVALARNLGWRTTEHTSGESLIHHLSERIKAGEPAPDVLLIDGDLPDFSGAQALEQLKQSIGEDKLPATVMVCTHDRPCADDNAPGGQRQRILTKPLNASTLFNGISDAIVEREGSTDKLLRNTRLVNLHAQWLANITVLLVDDSEINLEIAQQLLENHSAKVITASNGARAIQALHDNPGLFDVVLMDIQMPVMDGLEATRRLRSEPGFSTLPVIALTAGALVQERERARDAGMNDFLTKPLEPEPLIRSIRKHVEQARGAPLPMVSATRAKPSHIDWPEIPGIDSQAAATCLGNDARLFLKMLGLLETDFADIAGIDTQEKATGLLADEASRVGLSERMHKLRGSAGAVGAKQLHAQASLTEAALKHHSGEEIELVLALGKTLRQLIKDFQPLVASHRAGLSAALAESAAGAAPADRPTLETFARLLQEQDLEALSMHTEMEGPLAAALGEETFFALSHAMETLDFPRARALVEQSLEP
jgi:PAS domain S-box-containing protein